MTHHAATPDTLEEIAAHARPGDRITLQYDKEKHYGRTTLVGLRGPITVDAEEGVSFDGGQRRQDFDLVANAEAKRQQDAGEYPGLYGIAMQGYLVLRDCVDITFTGFGFRGCWPTCIAIKNCRDLTFTHMEFREGTYAVYAEGRRTRGLTFDNCTFVQDITEHEMWREISWERIHSNLPVRKTDARALDGEFLRTFGIAGDVTVRHCTIRHAFNGIHMYHSDDQGKGPNINRGVYIHDNRLEYIRDNAIEPEHGAYDWWVFHNSVRNCHKVFSVECVRSGPTYFVGNTYWFDEKPTVHLDYNGGAMWKLKKKVKPTGGTNHVLHNSFYLRSKYIKKRRWRDLMHRNNAIQYAAEPCHPEGLYDPSQSFFGRITAADEENRFTKDWDALQISFAGDMAHHFQFPEALVAGGYALEHTRGDAPGFVDPRHGDFRLRAGAAARGAAHPFQIKLPDGTLWPTLPATDVGAFQGESRIAMPLVAYGPTRAGV